MKIHSLYKSVTLLTFLAIAFSCIEDNEYGIPPIDTTADPTEGLTPNITIAQAKALFSGDNTEFISNLLMEGYVVSSDASGNFYKELYIQDHPSNPTAGVRIIIDKTSLYQTYPIGRRIIVKLQGLFIGEGDGNVLTIGKEVNGSLSAISAASVDTYIIRSATIAAIEGKTIHFSDITEQHLGLFITVPGTQFTKTEVGLPFVDPHETFDTQRTLESCEEEASFILETNAFAHFKQIPLPGASGVISGIVSRNFSASSLVLVLNEASDWVNEGARCDPPVIDCGIAPATGPNNLLTENFESQTLGNPVSGGGWTNFIEAGTRNWTAYTSGGANPSLGISARIGSNMSGDPSSIAWLISPAINMDAQAGEVVTFKTSNNFADGSQLKVLISTNWNGDPATITSATWAELAVAIIVPDTQPFGDWIDSGNIDLSCATGTAYIAFTYIGRGDASEDGTYELDEIQITSQ